METTLCSISAPLSTGGLPTDGPVGDRSRDRPTDRQRGERFRRGRPTAEGPGGDRSLDRLASRLGVGVTSRLEEGVAQVKSAMGPDSDVVTGGERISADGRDPLPAIDLNSH